MKKVGRNDLCPCGSGKKYKKCCGESNIIPIESIIEKELRELQLDILDYAVHTYDEEMNEALSDWFLELYIPEDALEMFHFFTLSWYITSIEINGKTILEDYIHKKSSKWTRNRTKEILRSWKNAKPAIAVIQDQDEFKQITLQDIYTDETYKVKVLDDDHAVETGGIVIGIILPTDETSVFFTSFIDLPAGLSDRVKEAADQLAAESEEADPTEYLRANYPEALHLFIFGPEPTIDDLEWTSPKHLEVAQEFKDYIEDFHDETIIKLGTYLWHQYCSRKNPKIVKSSIYVAALIYLMDQLIPFGGLLTQNQLAQEFDISSSSLSSRYRDMENILHAELEDLQEKLDEIDLEEMYDDVFLDEDDDDDFFEEDGLNDHPHAKISMERDLLKLERDLHDQDFESIDEINQFLNQQINHPNTPKKALTDKEKAQDLVFDAYEADTEQKKRQLAEKALHIYPNTPDAYNLLADFEFDDAKKEQLLLKAIEVSEKELGKEFIVENKGHFWAMVHTRPYMRAKFSYAELLREMDRLDEAIKQYEDLLALNANDNQGARYELFIAYMESQLYKQAETLLHQFDESTTTNGLYNRVLIEFYHHGRTPKARKLLLKASQQNPYVIDYLVGKREIPIFLPAHYQLGEKSEAAIYADAHFDLWASSPELMELLEEMTEI